MLLSINDIPEEYKYLENNKKGKGFIFIDNGATPEEKANLKKYDEDCLEIYGYHLIKNYEELDNV